LIEISTRGHIQQTARADKSIARIQRLVDRLEQEVSSLSHGEWVADCQHDPLIRLVDRVQCLGMRLNDLADNVGHR
jgi:hypothetical protein